VNKFEKIEISSFGFIDIGRDNRIVPTTIKNKKKNTRVLAGE
jgi:hypothetical protein